PLDLKLAASAIEVAPVTVVAASGVETRTSEVATNVTRQQVEHLPLSDRNFLDLVQLAPGTSIQSGGINDTRKTFAAGALPADNVNVFIDGTSYKNDRSEEHTSELQSLAYLVCRLLLEKKKKKKKNK